MMQLLVLTFINGPRCVSVSPPRELWDPKYEPENETGWKQLKLFSFYFTLFDI
jgi:hypothetical protein